LDWWGELYRLMRSAPPRRAESPVPFAKPREDGDASDEDGSFVALSGEAARSPAEARERAEAAADIRADLLHCAARAEAAGLPMLAYLIECAALEAGEEDVG
jgi:hypothetical protein